MSYQCMAFRLLISCPSDVPHETLAKIREAIARWNVQHGAAFSAVIIPMAWTDSAVAAFGDRPQALINEQLTDEADACLAIFRDKLGSPTGHAASGTWEEIERLAGGGRPVGILRDLTPRPALQGTDAAAESLRLQKHFESDVFHRALVLSFADMAALQNHVDAFLTRFTSQAQRSADIEKENRAIAPLTAEDPSKGVWPRIESSEHMETDSKGRLKTRRRHHLVLSNQTGGPVHNVRYEFHLPPGQMFDAHDRSSERTIATMPPNGETRFSLLFVMGSQSQAQCLVHWSDSSGEHTTEATVTV